MTLVSLSFGLYLTVETINDYSKNEFFTQTKRVRVNSTTLPSVTFCTEYTGAKEDLNYLFYQSHLDKMNGSHHILTDMIGEVFSDQTLGLNFYCVKFNNFRNQSGHELLVAEGITSEYFQFRVNLNLRFFFVYVFISDNYVNVLEWSQLVNMFGNIQRGGINIVLTKQIEYKLEAPYNDCKLTSDHTYRQVNCIAQCKNRRFLGKYNCTLRNYYSLPGKALCSGAMSFSLEFNSVCEAQCPAECISTKLSSRTNFYDSTYYGAYPEIYVSYSDLSFIEISQTPKMSGISLLNEIGGALGLFVGITFLSLLELLEYFFELVLVFCN